MRNKKIFHAVPYKMAASDSGDSGFMTFASSPVVFNQESSSTMSMIDSPVSFDSSTSFLQLSIDSHESSTRLGVLGLGKTKKIKPARTGPAETSLCEFCKVYLNSQIQAAAHYQGKGHLRKVKAAAKIAELEAAKMVPEASKIVETVPSKPQPAVNPPNYTTTAPAQPAPILPTASLTASRNPAMCSEPTVPLCCEACQKSFNSESQANQHFTSKTHQNRVQMMIPVTSAPVARATPPVSVPETKPAEVKLGGNVKTQLFRCNPCNITLNSETQFKQHTRGVRHKIIMGKAPAPPPAYEGWEGVRFKKLTSILNIQNSSSTVATATTCNMSMTGTRLGQFYCETCDVSVNSQSQLDQHLTSQKHQLVASGQAPRGGRGRGRGQASGRGRGGGNFRGGKVDGTPAGRGRGPPHIISPSRLPLSASFVKSGQHGSGANQGMPFQQGQQAHRGAHGVWRGQPRRGQRVAPY